MIPNDKKILSLLIDDDLSNLDLYNLCIENCHSTIEGHVATCAEMAIKKIKENKYHFIVCDYNMPNGNGDLVHKYIRKMNKTLPFVLFTTNEISDISYFSTELETDKSLFFIKKPCMSKAFKKKLKDILNPLKLFEAEEVTDYLRVRTVYFLRYNKTLCDIHIKLGENKYIKIIHKDSSYTYEEIAHYLNKKQEYLFIKKDQAERFEKRLSENKFLIETDLKNKKIDDALEKTMVIVHHLVNELGINKRVIELVDHSINAMEKEMKNSNKLFNLLSNFKKQNNYLHEHCYILGYICDAICSKMEWSAKDVRKKLYYAAILHDVTLTDNDLVSSIELDKDSDNKFDTKDLKKYRNHPLEVAQLIREQSNLPLNVDMIVENQHELPDGTGFPRQKSSQAVSQLEALFNLAYAFVIELYRNDFSKDEFSRIVKSLSIKYSKGNYKKPLEALQSVINDLEASPRINKNVSKE